MRIERIDCIDNLLKYKSDWNRILSEMKNDNLFLELDWIEKWWAFFGSHYRLCVLVLLKDGEIAGFGPFMETDKGLCKEIGFIGSREASSMDLMLRDPYREEGVAAICNFFRNQKGRKIIKLHGIPESSQNYELLKKYLEEDKAFTFSSFLNSYYIYIQGKDFYSHLEDKFGKETRANMNKREKRINRLGALTYKRIPPSKLDEIFEVHEKRWQRKIGNSSFSKGDNKEFYKELALKNDLGFEVTVDALLLKDRVISFVFGFEHNKRYLFKRIAHDDDFYFFSPGELVLKKKIEECFSFGEGIIDFGSGYEPFKAKWTDVHEKLTTVFFSADNLQSTLVLLLKYWTKIRLIAAIKNNKPLYHFKKYTLGKIKFTLSGSHLSSVLDKIRRTIKQYGLLKYMGNRLGAWTGKVFHYQRHVILERKLRNAHIAEGSFAVREADVEDIDLLAQLMIMPASHIIRRFANRHRCYIALQKEEPVFYCWINCSGVELSGMKQHISFGEGDAFIYDVFLKRQYGEADYLWILQNVMGLLAKAGFKTCYMASQGHPQGDAEILHPRYEIKEKKVFGTVTHQLADIKQRTRQDKLKMECEGL